MHTHELSVSTAVPLFRTLNTKVFFVRPISVWVNGYFFISFKEFPPCIYFFLLRAITSVQSERIITSKSTKLSINYHSITDIMYNSNNGFTLTYYPILQLLDFKQRKVERRQWISFIVTDGYTLRDMHVYPSLSIDPLLENTRVFDVITIRQYQDQTGSFDGNFEGEAYFPEGHNEVNQTITKKKKRSKSNNISFLFITTLNMWIVHTVLKLNTNHQNDYTNHFDMKRSYPVFSVHVIIPSSL